MTAVIDRDPSRPGGRQIPAIRSELLAARRWITARWQWLAGLGIVLMLIVLPTYPGRANHDTDAMVQNMDAGAYTDWWSPLLMMAWRPFYEIGIGLGFIQIGQTIAVFAAIGSLVRPVFVRTSTAVTATIVVCLFPTSYSMLVNSIRDTWFTAAVVAGVAIIYRTRTPRAAHGALLALSLFTIVAARQNGVLVVVVLAFAASAHWGLLRVGRSRARRIAVWAGMSLGAGLACFGLAQAAVRLADVTPTGPETATYYVDLDDMSTRVGEMLVPDVYVRDGVDLTLDDLATARNYSADPIKPLVVLRLPPEDRGVAAEAWRDAVTEHPLEYLQARWQMFTRQVGWSGAPAESHYPTEGTSRLFSPRSVRMSSLSTAYLSMFDGGDWSRGGIVHRPWLYLAGAAIAALRFGRRWPLLWCIPAVQVALLVGLFFLAPVSKTRLVYPVFLLGLVAAVYLVMGGRRILQDELATTRMQLIDQTGR